MNSSVSLSSMLQDGQEGQILFWLDKRQGDQCFGATIPSNFNLGPIWKRDCRPHRFRLIWSHYI